MHYFGSSLSGALQFLLLFLGDNLKWTHNSSAKKLALCLDEIGCVSEFHHFYNENGFIYDGSIEVNSPNTMAFHPFDLLSNSEQGVKNRTRIISGKNKSRLLTPEYEFQHGLLDAKDYEKFIWKCLQGEK